MLARNDQLSRRSAGSTLVMDSPLPPPVPPGKVPSTASCTPQYPALSYVAQPGTA